MLAIHGIDPASAPVKETEKGTIDQEYRLRMLESMDTREVWGVVEAVDLGRPIGLTYQKQTA